jgi:hypothetical protein
VTIDRSALSEREPQADGQLRSELLRIVAGKQIGRVLDAAQRVDHVDGQRLHLSQRVQQAFDARPAAGDEDAVEAFGIPGGLQVGGRFVQAVSQVLAEALDLLARVEAAAAAHQRRRGLVATDLVALLDGAQDVVDAGG